MKSSYESIFKSSAWIGLQQGVTIIVGIVQAKVVALLLGASGTGAFGVYAALQTLAQGVAGMGVAGSGVRAVAVSNAGGGGIPVAGLVRVIPRLGLILGGIGMGIMLIFRKQISVWSFGDEQHIVGVVFVAIAVLLTLVSTHQAALLQGFRRMRDLTLANMIGTTGGALSAIFLVWRYRTEGIAPAFSMAAACMLLGSWLFSRQLPSAPVALPWRDLMQEVGQMVRLGMGFLARVVFISASSYAIRLILYRYGGMAEAGIFQASWMLTTFYVTVILQAMGTDFLPRLSASSERRDDFNRLVNEQTETGMLIAIPGLIMSLLFAPWMLRLLYTEEFLAGTSMARWMILGMMIRAISWPSTYVPLAKNKSRVTVIMEAFANVLLVGLTWLGRKYLGLEGVGIAFFVSSIFYTVGGLWVAHFLTGYRLSSRCRNIFFLGYPIIALVFFLLRGNAHIFTLAFAAATLISLLLCGWCFKKAYRLFRYRGE